VDAVEKQTYYRGTGRRKTAVARVKLSPGNGAIIVNGTPYDKLFPSHEHQRAILRPLLVTENMGKYNVVIDVSGGGISGQAGAISHGISRALVVTNEGLKTVLRQYKLLTRDARAKERKKVGLRRARKAPQYTKR
jgi:small subunit ribosomal protein S9